MISSLFASLAGPTVDEDIEQLGKKDDDLKISDDHRDMNTSIWLWGRSMLRMRKRRMVMLAAALFVIWFLFTHRLQDMLHRSDPTSEIDVNEFSIDGTAAALGLLGRKPYTVQNERPGYDVNERLGTMELPLPPKRKKEGRPIQRKETGTQHYYEGQLQFFSLPASIRLIGHTGGSRTLNQNVLFAASNLQSAARLIPLACEMGRRGSNYVHMAFMGRNDMYVNEILEINGVDKTTCKVFFHDARPDFAPFSSDLRAEAAVKSALTHIFDFMHPQVIITDSVNLDDGFFTRGIQAKAKEYAWPVIEIPSLDRAAEKQIGRPTDSLSWISRLDCRSLASWHVARVEVLIQAPTESAGSVIHLLKSLANADYSGITPPRLTIELPSETDPMLHAFLSSFVWPPNKGSASSSSGDSHVTIRHRIPIRTQSPEEASIRFFESFYPLQPRDSHILVLAPTTQLSPLYYQSLRYNLLSYRYSINSATTSTPFLGIALDLPKIHLNGSALFTPPDLSFFDPEILQIMKPQSPHARPPFLWEAPDSNAVLYFGEQWCELHSFLSLRLARLETDGGASAMRRTKLIAAHMPSWTEYVLEFMRARGYSLLFPGSSVAQEAMAAVHHELDHGPEEFRLERPLAKRDAPVKASAKEAYNPSEQQTTVKESSASPNDESHDIPIFTDPFLPPDDRPNQPASDKPFVQTFQPLDALLPFSGPEPPLGALPHLAFDGTLISERQGVMLPARNAEKFRRDVGGCANVLAPKGRKRKVKVGSAGDLFCFGDEEWEDMMPGEIEESLDVAEDVQAKKQERRR